MSRQRISGLEFSALLVGFLIGSSALLTPGALAEHEAWLAVLIAIAPGCGLGLLYAWLIQRFPRQSMVEIARTVFGKVIGTVIALLYVSYIYLLGSWIITDFGDFFTTMVFTRTPEWSLLVVFAALSGYAVWCGIEPLARTATLLVGPILIIYFIDIVLLLVGRFEIRHLMPLFETPLPRLLWTVWTSLAFPFAETVAFMMIAPSLHRPREARRRLVTAIAFVGVLFVIVTVRNAAALGRSLPNYAYPSFQALRMVDIGSFLTRFEVAVAAVFIATGFMKLSVLYYGSAVGLAQVLGLKDYRTLIGPLGMLLVLLGLHSYGSLLENTEFANQIYPVYAAVFQIVIPLATMIVAKVRHLPRPGPGQNVGATGSAGGGDS